MRLCAVIMVAALWTSAAGAAPVEVTFQVNDSYVKDKVLPGVAIGVAVSADADYAATGKTGSDGRLTVRLETGAYLVNYRLDGYVPVALSPIEVGETPLLVTTTLTMMMENTGLAGHERIQIVLNWGSDRDRHVKDADSHLACACLKPGGHVYFRNRLHEADGHKVDLDVDDIDWGGPETVTLLDAKPGEYTYWVYDYSGDDEKLGESEVVVRVVFGDRVAGEFKIPKRVQTRYWRPFRAIVVDGPGQPRIERFSETELVSGVDASEPPASLIPPEAPGSGGSDSAIDDIFAAGCTVTVFFAVFIILAVVVILAVVRARRRR